MAVELTRADLDRLTAGAPGPDRVVELLSDVFVAVDPSEPDVIPAVRDEQDSAA